MGYSMLTKEDKRLRSLPHDDYTAEKTCWVRSWMQEAENESICSVRSSLSGEKISMSVTDQIGGNALKRFDTILKKLRDSGVEEKDKVREMRSLELEAMKRESHLNTAGGDQ